MKPGQVLMSSPPPPQHTAAWQTLLSTTQLNRTPALFGLGFKGTIYKLISAMFA